MTTELLEKPAKVILAMRIFYFVIAIGVARVIMTVIRHADVRSPVFLIVTKLLFYAACVFVLYHLGKGDNRARWTLVALLVISFPLIILPAYGGISHNMVQTALTFLQVVLYVVALVFLFHKSSSAWFDTGGVSREQ